MIQFVLSKKYWILAGVIFAGLGTWFFVSSSTKDTDGIETSLVSKGEVVEIVSETGYVLPAQSVALAFERGGRVMDIPVTEGVYVEEGDVLIQLDASQQEADMTTAYARLQAEQLRLKELQNGADSSSLAVTKSTVDAALVAVENAKRNLAEVISQQNQFVTNAEKTLRSSGLQAYLTSEEREDSDLVYTAPTITGTYDSDIEGVYALELYNSAAASGASFRYTGLESGTQSVSTVNPGTLGTRGLYIQFPDNFAKSTLWEVPIPNTRSSSYLANLNAYKAVVDARNIAIANAQNAVEAAEAALAQTNSQFMQASGSARDEKIAAQQALVKQMEAAVSVAQVAYDNTMIRAPFSGIVTSIKTEKGEIIASSVPVVSLISSENFELVVNISESDIKEVTIDDTASVILDAYDDLVFEAQITRIAPNAVVVDGVRVFEVRLQFTREDELIRSGLSADIDINAALRTDVLAVPSRAVVEKEDGKFVRTFVNNKIEYIPVQVGLRGSNGMVEIVGGLTVGQSIITFINTVTLEKLESK